MKKILIILAALQILACKDQKEVEVKTAPSHIQETSAVKTTKDLNETETTEQVTFEDEESATILDGYLKVKAALVNTDAVQAATHASQLEKQLANFDPGNDGIQNLKVSLQELAATQSIAEQRSVFEAVSRQVEAVIDDEIATGMVFKQYCPMAFDGKGAYWLSDSKEIRNPYFGDKMLTCGVVDRRIN